VRWSLLWSDNQSLPQPFGTSKKRIIPIGIYRDQSLIPEGADTYAAIQSMALQRGDGVVNTTKLSIDNNTVDPIAVVGTHAWDDFSTDIILSQASSGHAWTTPSLVRQPCLSLYHSADPLNHVI
jgi:hypothetical protein